LALVRKLTAELSANDQSIEGFPAGFRNNFPFQNGKSFLFWKISKVNKSVAGTTMQA
jgi:hypothetical protein